MPPFSTDRWRVLSPYLDQALEMDAEARARWLASILARDPSLAAELQSLLTEHETLRMTRFLEGSLRDDLDT